MNSGKHPPPRSHPLHFADRLQAAIRVRGTPGVVGLDPVLERLPEALRPTVADAASAAAAIERFCEAALDAVAGLVPAVKINSAFFEAFYEWGVAAYYRLVQSAHRRGLLVIGDVKRGDIGSTAQLYARGHLAQPAFADVEPDRIPDAVTLAGYLGVNAVRPFIDAAITTGRGLFVLVRPSDPGADAVHEFGESRHFYQHLAELVRAWGRSPGALGACGLSCVGAVVAPKDAASTAALRAAMPETPFLVPGYGAQGATAESCRPCFRSDGSGAIVNASRSVLFAFETAESKARFGADWPAAIRAACEQFARDTAGLIGPSRPRGAG